MDSLHQRSDITLEKKPCLVPGNLNYDNLYLKMNNDENSKCTWINTVYINNIQSHYKYWGKYILKLLVKAILYCNYKVKMINHNSQYLKNDFK